VFLTERGDEFATQMRRRPFAFDARQITEAVGCGPFKFVKEEFEPGHQVVYVKNADYVPRKELRSWASGGKVVKVDRVEWLYIPDATTKVAALNAREADWRENPPLELLPALTSNLLATYVFTVFALSEIAGPRASPMPNQEPLAFALSRRMPHQLKSVTFRSLGKLRSKSQSKESEHGVDWQGCPGHGGAAGNRPCDGP
jgi:hypothetical protein